MTKTPVTYKDTKLGVLEIHEIEKIITDNLALVQKYIIRHFDVLSVNQETAKKLHRLLAHNVYEAVGSYRKHNIQLGSFHPPEYYEVPILMQNWELDLHERIKTTKTRQKHIDNCAWLMHRFLWIHPFFDYNGRIARLLGELYLMQHQLPLVDFRKTRRTNFVEAMKYATETNNLDKINLLIDNQT